MTITQVPSFIEACDKANKVPLIEAVHGIGKSQSVKQYADNNNLHCEILILSLLDTGDLCGIPRTMEVAGQLSTVWAAPVWLTRIIDAAWPESILSDDLSYPDQSFHQFINDKLQPIMSRSELNELYCKYKGIPNTKLMLHTQCDTITYNKSKRSVLFLDELNRTTTDILNASLQLILDKTLNEHQLPVVNGKPTLIVAAINPSDSNYTVNSFDPALLSRFIHTKVEPDAESWLSYSNDKVPEVVRSFIAKHPNRIFYEPEDLSIGANPRAWNALGDLVNIINSVPAELHYELFKGCIGKELGAQFLSHYNNYSKAITKESIIKLVDTKRKSVRTVETMAKHVAKLIKDQEVIQKNELAEQLYKQFIDSKSFDDALPLMAYLYALEIEILAGFLKSKKADDYKGYSKLAKLDSENDKKLFIRIVDHLK